MCFKEIKVPLFRILSPYLLFHIIFHLQVWWSVEESGYPKVYHLFRTMKFSKLLKLSSLMIQKWNKSTYGPTPMGKMLCNSGLRYYVNWLVLENMEQKIFLFCSLVIPFLLCIQLYFLWSNFKFQNLWMEVDLKNLNVIFYLNFFKNLVNGPALSLLLSFLLSYSCFLVAYILFFFTKITSVFELFLMLFLKQLAVYPVCFWYWYVQLKWVFQMHIQCNCVVKNSSPSFDRWCRLLFPK